jgi:DNA processing protein
LKADARVRAWAALQLIPGLTGRALVPLLQALGGPVELAGASRASLAKIVPAALATAITNGPDPERLAATLEWLGRDGQHLVAWDDPDYPPQLLATADSPPVLQVSGRRELLSRAAVAIVGSRNATPQGLENAEQFAAAVSGAGLTVVSGLALGIDTSAHRGALAGQGSTVAVVGTGLDRVYPPANRELAHRIAREGALVSEFPLGTPPLPENFPRRNRVISGLAKGVLVVEATLRSGSLITARLAAEQGREVFAIPGSIHSPFSKGCHRLIRDGAKLVETASDILEELAFPHTSPMSEKSDEPALTLEAARVLEALGHDPAGFDLLIQRTSMSADALTVSLLELELNRHIAVLPGNAYQRLR